MRSYLILASLLLGSLFTRAIAAPAPQSLILGTWKIDLAKSTELSPWKDYEIQISQEGDTLTLKRRLAWGHREFFDGMQIDLRNSKNIIPVELWPDNRHLGAYIGGDRTKTVRADWLDEKRVLRINTDLVLDTQQGSRAVNILSNYQVSANGERLTLIEMRTTRNRPTVYIFHRVTSTPEKK